VRFRRLCLDGLEVQAYYLTCVPAGRGGRYVMTFIQRLFTSVVPRSWAASMEAESRAWMAHCPDCGIERSVWDMGGIRWKAAGNPRRLLKCLKCQRSTWHQLTFKQP
jgi:hypothetical protein